MLSFCVATEISSKRSVSEGLGSFSAQKLQAIILRFQIFKKFNTFVFQYYTWPLYPDKFRQSNLKLVEDDSFVDSCLDQKCKCNKLEDMRWLPATMTLLTS